MGRNIVDMPWRYAHVTEDTVVTTSPVILHSITINHPDDGQNTPEAVVYNGVDATGTAIATIDLTGGHVFPNTLFYDIRLNDGLFIDIVGTAANVDLTVMYY